jgi:hypothetical protein
VSPAAILTVILQTAAIALNIYEKLGEVVKIVIPVVLVTIVEPIIIVH